MPELGERISALEAGFAEFKEAVKEQFKDLKRLIYVGLACIVAVWGGIAFLYKELRTISSVVEKVDDKLKIVAVDVSQIKTRAVSLGLDDAKHTVVVPILDQSDREFIQKNPPE